VTAVGVAAIASLEMVSGGKDEVGAFVIKVFRKKLGGRGFLRLFPR
jgi:hypothetical protein